VVAPAVRDGSKSFGERNVDAVPGSIVAVRAVHDYQRSTLAAFDVSNASRAEVDHVH
jgi:hypothetical protein